MRKILLLIPLLTLLVHSHGLAEDALSNILQGIKNRYGLTSGLTVPYTRDVMTRSMSMLGAQAKGDLASGIIHFKSPHFLRLDQEKPSPEIIIAMTISFGGTSPTRRRPTGIKPKISAGNLGCSVIFSAV